MINVCENLPIIDDNGVELKSCNHRWERWWSVLAYTRYGCENCSECELICHLCISGVRHDVNVIVSLIAWSSSWRRTLWPVPVRGWRTTSGLVGNCVVRQVASSMLWSVSLNIAKLNQVAFALNADKCNQTLFDKLQMVRYKDSRSAWTYWRWNWM